MGQIFYFITLTLILWSCNSSTNKTADTLHTVSADEKPLNIYIKDKSQYDKAFIDGLSDYNEPIKLIDNYIITGTDTTYFPSDLTLNKTIVFKGTKGNNHFVLSVKRVNLTNLNYNFEIIDKNNEPIELKTGKVTLGSMFFLASEVDEDVETGEGYGSYDYWQKTNDCILSIRIGIGNDANGKLTAKIAYNYNDKSKKTLELNDCPTLKTE